VRRLQRKRFLKRLGQKSRAIIFSMAIPLLAGLSSCCPAPSTVPQTCREKKAIDSLFMPDCNKGSKITRSDSLPNFAFKERIFFNELNRESCKYDLISTTFSGEDKRLHFSDHSVASGRDFSGSKTISISSKQESLEDGKCTSSKQMSTMKIADLSTNKLHDTGVTNFGYAFFWGQKVIYAKLKEEQGRKLSDIYVYDPQTKKSKLLVEQAFLPGDKPVSGDKLVYASFADGLLRIRDLLSEEEVTLEDERFTGDPYSLQVHADKHLVVLNGPANLGTPMSIYSMDGQVKRTIPKTDIGFGFPFRSMLLQGNLFIYIKSPYLMFSIPTAVDLESGNEFPLVNPQDIFAIGCRELTYYGPIDIINTKFFTDGKKLFVITGAEFCRSDEPPNIYYYSVKEFDFDKLDKFLK
jgi:hypothetical protein